MKKKFSIFPWLPVIGWMVFVFLLSTRQRISISDEFTLNFIFFKTLHIIEYVVLFVLTVRALNQTTTLPLKRMLTTALCIGILYAISDEIHQAFVPTRQGAIKDILIDTGAMSVMYLLLLSHFAKIKRYL